MFLKNLRWLVIVEGYAIMMSATKAILSRLHGAQLLQSPISSHYLSICWSMWCACSHLCCLQYNQLAISYAKIKVKQWITLNRNHVGSMKVSLLGGIWLTQIMAQRLLSQFLTGAMDVSTHSNPTELLKSFWRSFCFLPHTKSGNSHS